VSGKSDPKSGLEQWLKNDPEKVPETVLEKVTRKSALKKCPPKVAGKSALKKWLKKCPQKVSSKSA
jgi:hypothetical protein